MEHQAVAVLLVVEELPAHQVAVVVLDMMDYQEEQDQMV